MLRSPSPAMVLPSNTGFAAERITDRLIRAFGTNHTPMFG
jgi:hypothetical protein